VEAHLMPAAAVPAIDPDAICRQWSEARGGKASIATMNFIVYVENERYRDWVRERAQRIADKHPSRMIVLDAVKGERGARIVAGGAERRESSSVFRERVDLGIDGVRAAQRVHLVQALLARDIPCVLWWAADRLFSSETFKGLLAIVQHVILDSSGTGKDPDAIREFANFFADRRDVLLGDLAWMRLDPWRDVVAQFFDDPGLRQELFSLRKVRIASGSDSEALYLGCWLASRLGWDVADGSSFRDRAGVTIPFERAREGEIRRVRRVVLESTTSTYSAYVDGENVVCLEVSGKFASPKRHVPLQAIDNTSLVERALLRNQADEIFLESLQTVGRLLE
jgi:glucose-6-phosphate dehydrogenase assembly protein OpcA